MTEEPSPPIPSVELPEFVPAAWARGGHLQTVLGHLLPHPAARVTTYPGARRHWIELGDGDALHAVEVPARTDERGSIVTLFHGLGGSVDADYVRGATAALTGSGHTVLAVDHRGCGAGVGRTSRPWHAGCRDDLAAALDFARTLAPKAHHTAIGFSLSGNALLVLQVEDPDRAPDLAVAVHPPVDLARCSHRLLAGVNRLYDVRFTRQMKLWLRDAVASGRIESPGRLGALATLRDFDEHFTGRAAGFDGRDAYYAACSTHERLTEITRPTHLLVAADDPFVPLDMLRDAPRSDAVTVHVQPTGGHLGYLAAAPTPLGTRRWLDWALRELVSGAVGGR